MTTRITPLTRQRETANLRDVVAGLADTQASRVLEFELVDDELWISEKCDDEFAAPLNADQVDQLATWLAAQARHMRTIGA